GGKGNGQQALLRAPGAHSARDVQEGLRDHPAVPPDPDPAALLHDEEASRAVAGVGEVDGPVQAGDEGLQGEAHRPGIRLRLGNGRVSCASGTTGCVLRLTGGLDPIPVVDPAGTGSRAGFIPGIDLFLLHPLIITRGAAPLVLVTGSAAPRQQQQDQHHERRHGAPSRGQHPASTPSPWRCCCPLSCSPQESLAGQRKRLKFKAVTGFVEGCGMDELPPAQERINEIRRRRREHIFPGVTTYYDQSLVVDRAEGMYVYGMDGRQYLDFFAGILTVQVGHCDPEITQAVVDQLHKVWHTSTVFDTEPMGLVAEKLAQLAPGDLTHTFFCNSGTEANETAVMLAQLFTRNPEILAFRHSYHGRSAVALSLTGQAAWRKGANLPGVRHIPSPYCYRCPYGQEPESCNLQCVKEIEEIIQTTTSGEIAGFIAEPILGLGGLITPPDDYFKEAVPIIRRYGGLFIADEVQTGFGRTGTYMFGIQHWGVEPDIMTFAKGIANGLPVGATLARADVAAALKPPTISTFGGNPVSMAGAWATIQVLENRGLVDNARVQGERLRQGLLALQE